jgi:hypothetical protein
MSADEEPTTGDDQDESVDAPDTGADEPETPPQPRDGSEAEKDDSSENSEKDTAEEDLKADATNQDSAQRLARHRRTRADAVAAILGGTTQATNVFIGATIGLVDSGGQRQTSNARESLATGSVTDEALRRVVTTFVEPRCYGSLRSRLRGRSVVLLRAAPGWGRTTTALHLLNNECAQGVEKLNPDVSLRVPKGLELRAGRGHLLEWLDVDEADRLHEFHLERLKQELDKVGARMVVLLDPSTPIREDALSSYVVEGGDPPDSRAVAAKHFTAHLAAVGKPDQTLADFPEFTEVVDEFVETARKVGNVVELARDLGEVVLNRIDLAAVRDRYADTAETAFRAWFDELADNDQRAFAVALAVFNGMPMHTVAGTATRLGKAMQAAENPDRRNRHRSVFALRRTDLVERVRAGVSEESEITDLGPLAAHVVRYCDDRRPRKVLEHVWWEYDEAHEVVRRWLYQLGESPDIRVCVRAGVAVGLLSLSEFDHVRQLVIEPWADTNSGDRLQAVMGALELPSQRAELQPLFVKMLVGWLGSESIGRKVAAITALGTFGVVSPGRALKMMRRAAGARNSDIAVRLATAEAVTSLAVIPGRLGQVMVTVLKWSDDLRPRVRGTGLECALRLSSNLRISTDDTVEAWPALLHVAVHDPPPPHPLVYQGTEIGYRRAVVIMLERLLSAPFYMSEGLKVIRLWMEIAQKDPAQRGPLGRLLFDVAEETGDRDSLRFYLDDWATGRRNSSEAVADIVAAMDQEGQDRG